MDWKIDVENKLIQILSGNKSQNCFHYWNSYKDWYQSAIICDTKQEIYIFLIEKELNNIPLVTKITFNDVEQRCLEQGFESGTTIKNIWKEVCENLNDYSNMEFSVKESEIELEVKFTEILKIKFISVGQRLSDGWLTSIIYSSLTEEIISTAQIYAEERNGLLDVIDKKDQNIEYLIDCINDLGGQRFLDKWAPKGSINNKYLRKFNKMAQRENTFKHHLESSNDMNIDELFQLKREFSKFFEDNQNEILDISHGDNDLQDTFDPISSFGESSSKKTKRKNDECVFNNAEKPSKMNQESYSTSITDDSEKSLSSSTNLSQSPTKKRRFGKVRTSK